MSSGGMAPCDGVVTGYSFRPIHLSQLRLALQDQFRAWSLYGFVPQGVPPSGDYSSIYFYFVF